MKPRKENRDMIFESFVVFCLAYIGLDIFCRKYPILPTPKREEKNELREKRNKDM